MARSAPSRATGRMARRAQQSNRTQRSQRPRSGVLQPAVMCALLALVLALSIAFGRPSGSAVNASVTPQPTPSAESAAPATEATATPQPTPTPTLAPRPSYDAQTNDGYNRALAAYQQDVLAKLVGPNGSTDYEDLAFFQQEGLTPRWFGLTAVDLPMLRGKLEAGAPTPYTMSLICLVMGYEPAVRPNESDAATQAAWLDEFEAKRAAAVESVKQRRLEGLGAFALPYAYEEINAGTGEDLFTQLPALTDGFEGLNREDTAAWSQADWLVWLRGRDATWAAMKEALAEPILLPWIKLP